MKIGFMRNNKNPTELAKLVSITSKSYGIDVIYLRPKDVDMLNGKVSGKIFINNKWIQIQTELPKFIDISRFCFKRKNREIINYLRENTILSDDGRISFNKKRLQEKLSEDPKFKNLVIPSKIANEFDDILNFVEDYKKIVLKPVSGQFGDGIYILIKDDKNYRLLFKDNEEILSKQEIHNFFNEKIKGKRYLIQKYINSKTRQGYPFDCRINVEKNGKGEWETARKFIRIGIGQKVVSNISQGGGVSNVKPFLKTNFGDKWKQIINDIDEIANTLPYKIEQLRETELMTLGIDIGIDSDGKVYLFETNSAPGTTQLRAEVALLRAQYYNFVLNNYVKSIDYNSK